MIEHKIHIINWLKKWFISRNSLSQLPDNYENQNYFEIGLIDSFNIIELVEAIETEFNIRFNQNHFQDKRFSSMNGLAEIIENLKQDEC